MKHVSRPVLAALLATFAAGVLVGYLLRVPQPARRAADALAPTALESRGWYKVSAARDGRDWRSFHVCDRARPWESLGDLRKGEAYRGDWKGVVWVSENPPPENARRWPADMQATGRGLWLYGDPDMLPAVIDSLRQR